MFDHMKRKMFRSLLIGSLVLNGAFVIENGSAYAAMKTGLIQGQVKPPVVAFGGYDAETEQQIAMLSDAIPAEAMKPIPDRLPAVAKAVPVPERKPTLVKAVR